MEANQVNKIVTEAPTKVWRVPEPEFKDETVIAQAIEIIKRTGETKVDYFMRVLVLDGNQGWALIRELQHRGILGKRDQITLQWEILI